MVPWNSFLKLEDVKFLLAYFGIGPRTVLQRFHRATETWTAVFTPGDMFWLGADIKVLCLRTPGYGICEGFGAEVSLMEEAGPIWPRAPMLRGPTPAFVVDVVVDDAVQVAPQQTEDCTKFQAMFPYSPRTTQRHAKRDRDIAGTKAPPPTATSSPVTLSATSNLPAALALTIPANRVKVSRAKVVAAAQRKRTSEAAFTSTSTSGVASTPVKRKRTSEAASTSVKRKRTSGGASASTVTSTAAIASSPAKDLRKNPKVGKALAATVKRNLARAPHDDRGEGPSTGRRVGRDDVGSRDAGLSDDEEWPGALEWVEDSAVFRLVYVTDLTGEDMSGEE